MTGTPTTDSLADDVGFTLAETYNASRLLWDNLPGNADRAAIHCDGGTVTYGELARRAARIGNCLLSGGATPGERVLLFMNDEPDYVAAIMGAMRAGLVPLLINTLSPPDLIRFFLEDSGAGAIICSAEYRDVFAGDLVAGTSCRNVLVAGEHAPWANASDTLPEHPTHRTDMAFWMYSSGSTGNPKGVVHRHEDAPYTAATYERSVLKLAPDDICFSVPKIFFAYGFGNSVSFPFSRGASTVLMSGRPDPASVYRQIARHRPTVLFGLPTLYTALARHPAADSADLGSVRLCLSAAEVLSADIAGAWKERFGLDIVEGLGSTEMLHIYLSNEPDDRRTGSAGRVVPGYAVRLDGPDGSEVKQGEEGVMSVLGLSGAHMYWNRPDKTGETMRDGWIYTGDRFVEDENGFFYFRGRADDLVKVSGQWVYPLEIELALNEHDGVHECCVQAIELADKRLTLVAWVVPADGSSPDDGFAETLKGYAKQALLPHKYPRRVIFLDALPKTGTDKIDRQSLRNTLDGM